MIPVKIELYNFLAYRRPNPLDFTGMHLACLAGANGAGKSSLLDAITWALWGKARAHTDNELIYGNEMEMQVALTFALEGNLYRVIRHRNRKGAGSSQLSLEVQDNDNWRMISESTIRATQDRLNQLMRLDYSTFINSAFLMQGRADEFTKKTPGERKTILGEILGLDMWDLYEERSKTHLKQISQWHGDSERQIGEIDAELSHEIDYQRNLIEAQQTLEQIKQQVHDTELRYIELQEARNQLNTTRLRHDDLRGRIQQADTEMKHLQNDRDQQLARLDTLRDTVANQQEIEAGYLAWLNARQQEKDFNDRLREQGALLQRQSALTQSISAARAEIAANLSTFRQRIADYDKALADGADQPAVKNTQNQIASLESREQDMNSLKSEIEAARVELARLEGANQGVKVEGETIASQLTLIRSAREPLCPLCGQPLSDEHRIELEQTLTARRAEKETQWRDNIQQIEGLKSRIGSLSKEVSKIEPELRKLTALRELLARLAERSSRSTNAQTEKESALSEIAVLESTLESNDFAKEEHIALAEVNAQLIAVGYDEVSHQQVMAAVAEYDGYERRKVDLDGALDTIPQIESSVALIEDRIALWQQRFGEDQIALENAQQEIETLGEQLVGFDQLERDLLDLRDKAGDAQAAVGAAEQKIKALGDLRNRREQLFERRELLSQERSVYEELRLAFGKDGVPAMIIEAAIPEIEERANQILSRMTDGKMNIRFDTQRETVSGQTRETLDIKISDELGTRDYATFSGGEAFRVNFAVRLALSRLLAHRSGAQLRTLIIDEGFGTQDAQGRERLVGALNAIQDEFDLILVITHIDELKEAFPARIEITKTPEGSMIEVT